LAAEYFFQLLNPAISLVLATTFLLLWRGRRGYIYLLLLAFAFMLCGAAFAANDFLEPFDGAALRVLVNSLFLAAVISACMSALVRIKVPVPTLLFTGLCVCGAIAFCWFLFVRPSIFARIYVVNAIFAVMAMSTTVALIRARPKNKMDWLFVGLAAFLLVISVSRPVAMSLEWLDINKDGPLTDSDYWATVQALTPLLALAIALAFIAAFGLQVFDELRDLADRDHLTGLLNRRGFDKRSEALLEASANDDQAAAMMIDIDNFKAINDRFGHSVGDQAIIAVGRVLMKRGGDDLVGRTGGEEFALFFKDANRTELLSRASSIRSDLSSATVEQLPQGHRLTVSIGIHQWRERETLSEMMRQADEALYVAKRSGKDQAAFSRPLLRSVS
jgi:diguanylate cyclase (GGDEF)-like protein